MRKLSLLLLCFALGGLAVAVRAEDPSASAVPPAALPAIDHMVYLSFLPEPEELMADAKVNGLTVLRLDKTANRVVVSYQYPDGHTATLGYALLNSVSNADRVAAKRPTAEVTREPEIIYVERPYTRTRVIYRDRYDDFWLPLTLGLGLGYISSHHGHHGHYRSYSHYRRHR